MNMNNQGNMDASRRKFLVALLVMMLVALSCVTAGIILLMRGGLTGGGGPAMGGGGGISSRAECGNGSMESSEECDDGNTVSGDGCSATCTTENPDIASPAILVNGRKQKKGQFVNVGDKIQISFKLKDYRRGVDKVMIRDPFTKELEEAKIGYNGKVTYPDKGKFNVEKAGYYPFIIEVQRGNDTSQLGFTDFTESAEAFVKNTIELHKSAIETALSFAAEGPVWQWPLFAERIDLWVAMAQGPNPRSIIPGKSDHAFIVPVPVDDSSFMELNRKLDDYLASEPTLAGSKGDFVQIKLDNNVNDVSYNQAEKTLSVPQNLLGQSGVSVCPSLINHKGLPFVTPLNAAANGRDPCSIWVSQLTAGALRPLGAPDDFQNSPALNAVSDFVTGYAGHVVDNFSIWDGLIYLGAGIDCIFFTKIGCGVLVAKIKIDAASALGDTLIDYIPNEDERESTRKVKNVAFAIVSASHSLSDLDSLVDMPVAAYELVGVGEVAEFGEPFSDLIVDGIHNADMSVKDKKAYVPFKYEGNPYTGVLYGVGTNPMQMCAQTSDCSSGLQCLKPFCLDKSAMCVSHKIKKCDGGDVYWYDSCNVKEDKAQECGDDDCVSGKCEPRCTPECHNDMQCDDGTSSSIDICVNPGGCDAHCSHWDTTGNLSDVVVDQRNVTVTIWDHQVEDGDRVLIKFNNEIINSNMEIFHAKKTIQLTLRKGINVFEIVALNEGSMNPNTAAIRISDVKSGKSEQSWELNQNQGAGFKVTLQN